MAKFSLQNPLDNNYNQTVVEFCERVMVEATAECKWYKISVYFTTRFQTLHMW